jgi:hypothetical protein
MSSMIEDLPGPQDNLEGLQQNEIEMQQIEMEQMQMQQRQQMEAEQMQRIENFEEKPTQIKLEIKKKSEIGILDTIKSEFNVNNLVVLVALYLACIPESNEIIRKVLSTFSNNAYSHFMVTIIKCIVLLLIIILTKYFYTKHM